MYPPNKLGGITAPLALPHFPKAGPEELWDRYGMSACAAGEALAMLNRPRPG